MSESIRVEHTDLPGVVVITPRAVSDNRGFFYESYNEDEFRHVVGMDVSFVQDNHSRSVMGVLRGLHYQLQPHAQGKLVRCTRGSIWDVAVDVTFGSSTLGTWFGTELSEGNRRQIWIPAGFAHGFVVLTDLADVQYKTTSRYAPECERSILWSDPTIGISWPFDGTPIVSERDQGAPVFRDATLMMGDHGDR